jgi:hypothetical protein
MSGWVKLHRKLMESDTFTRLTAIQKVIAIYIVLNANHSDGTWYDKYKGIEVEIKRSQLVTSRNKIVKEWFKNDKDVTEQKVRTCLDKLERLGFLTKCSANDYTIITVLNYEVYQCSDTDDNQEVNQVLTKSQPSSNQAITTNKNVKNVKNDKNVKKDNKDLPQKSPKRTYSEDNLYYRLANRFHKLAFENATDVGTAHLIKEPNLQKWADTFRLMFEINKVKENEIGEVVKFALSDSFYRTIIFSPNNLRKHYLAILTKMRTGGGDRGKYRAGASGHSSTDREAARKNEELFYGNDGSGKTTTDEFINNFE